LRGSGRREANRLPTTYRGMQIDRFDGLPVRHLPGGLRVLEARTFHARLLGLAYVDELRTGYGLLIPRCQSVHTFGMRFRLDLVFLDQAGAPFEVIQDVPPRRVASRLEARAVLETNAGEGVRFAAALTDAAPEARPFLNPSRRAA
jgi:uncharacterized membrane protein (UPF0127 family)